MARAIGEPHEQFLELLPGVEDGIATLSLIEAAERSHELGGELVEV